MSLIAHYPLNGNAKDITGKYDADTLAGITWSDGKIGGAADTTSTNSGYISGSNGWEIRGDFSFAVWAKRTGSDGSSLAGLMSTEHHPSPTSGVSFYLRSTTNSINVAVCDGVSRPTYSVVLPDDPDLWNHYVLTCKNNVLSVYQNGNLLDRRNSPVSEINHVYSRGWVMGRWATSYSTYNLVGLLDDARVYDHALSEREVISLSKGKIGTFLTQDGSENRSGLNPTESFGNVVWDSASSSFKFDGSSYVKLYPNIPSNPEELTFEFTAQVPSLVGFEGFIQFNGVPSYTSGFVVTANNSTTLRLRYWIDGGTNIIWNAGSFANNEPTHFCVTIKNKVITIYQNGIEVASGSYTNDFSLDGTVNVGLYSWSNNYLNGYVKNVGIYSTALNADEVKSLYQTGLAIDDHHRMHSAYLNEKPVNSAPPLSSWSLPSDAEIISDNEVVLNSGQMVSPIFDVDEPSSGNYYVVLYSEVSAPGRTDAGFYMGTSYYDENGNPTANSGGHTGNGHAGRFPRFERYRHRWNHDLGVGIKKMGMKFGSPTYTGYPIRVKAVQWAPFQLDDYVYHQYSSQAIIEDSYPNLEVERGKTSHNMFSEVGVTDQLQWWMPFKKDERSITENQITSSTIDSGVGFRGDAVYFPNTSHESIDVSNIRDILGTSTNSATFSIWVRRDASNNAYNMFMGQGTLYFSWRSDGSILWSMPTPSQTTLTSGTTYPNNEWIYCAFVVDGTIARMYINGTQRASRTLPGPINISSTFSFGEGRASSWYPFQGSVRDFKLFTKPLTPEEVAQEYQSSSKAMISKSTAFAKEFIEV